MERGGRKSRARSEGADFFPKNGGPFLKKEQNSSFLNVNGPFFFREWTVFIERSVLL